ncbi:MAG: hypothetical protein Q9201_005371 [Fulgogasparrea decipioides]
MKPPTAAAVVLVSLKNCLVNLPQPLVTVLASINAPVQNVIVEILVNVMARSGKDGRLSERSFYVGWSGMPSAKVFATHRKRPDRLGQEVELPSVEIDATFGRMLGLTAGQKVGLLLHPDPPLARTVNVEPLTPADWEIIELHANFLELNLLSQIRALPNPSFSALPSVQAQPAHPLTLHLSPTSTANIIISSLVPPLASTVPFAMIAPDAEVVVAPKPRPRLGERNGNRSISSTGQRSAGAPSARSGVSRREGSQVITKGKTLLLRPCDRKYCDGLFDNEDEQQKNAGLRVWISPETLASSAWDDVDFVTVSIVRPAKLDSPLDLSRVQKSKDIDSSDAATPASSVVAKLEPWHDSVNSLQATLSSLLCSSLLARDVVGGVVKLEPAPPPVPRNALSQLYIMPFISPSEQSHESIRSGGDLQSARGHALEAFHKLSSKSGSDKSIMDGPLTDGLLIPAPQQSNEAVAWQGGVLRFDPPTRSQGDSETTPVRWANGSLLSVAVDIGEVVDALQRTTSSEGGCNDWLPTEAPPMVGVDRLTKTLLSHLSHSSSILLVGGLGSGKTTLAQSLGCRLRSEAQYHISYLSCRKLTVDEIRVATAKQSVDRLFMAATWAVRAGGRALVILDDLEKLCPVETELQTQDNGRSQQISELICNCVRHHCVSNSGVTLLATAQNKESLNNLLVGANLFKEIVDLKAPDKDSRRKLLQSLTRNAHTPDHTANNGIDGHAPDGHNVDQAAWMDTSRPASPVIFSDSHLPVDSNLDFLDIAGQTDGYMPADLALLVSRAKNEALIRSVAASPGVPLEPDITLTRQDFDRALQGFVPATLRNVTLQSSKITFDSIGGLKTTRRTLLETLQYPTLYAPIFAQCPLRLRSGILLYGYPGCGKTLLASAVAGECGLNFISVKGPEILNKYIGASEKGVRDLFERAESARPCVLFFDEFDSIAPKRGHDSTGVTDRVVNQLLTLMDGAEGLSGVYVLAATSRPDLIDPALLRPGRLDKSILCDLPDCDDRLEILQAISRELRLNSSLVSAQQHGLYEIALRTEGYTGADLQAVVYNAHLEAIHDELQDRRVDREVWKHPKTASANGQRSSKSDIIHFRFGAKTDGESTSVSRAKGVSEYHTIAAKLEGIKGAKRANRKHHQNSPAQIADHGDVGDGANSGVKGTQEVLIQWHHLQASLQSTRCSISPQERERLRRFYREFVVGRNGEMPNGEGSTEIGGRSSLM